MGEKLLESFYAFRLNYRDFMFTTLDSSYDNIYLSSRSGSKLSSVCEGFKFPPRNELSCSVVVEVSSGRTSGN